MNATGRIDIGADGRVTGDVFVYPDGWRFENAANAGWGWSDLDGAEGERLSRLTHSRRLAVMAGAPEIEITPAMIEAGAEVIWRYCYDSMVYGSESGRELAIEVFEAMAHTGEGSIPKPHQLIVDHSGVTCWSPLFDSIQIEPLPQSGKRLRITIKSDKAAEFDLTEEQITHLVELLVSSSSASP